MMDMLRVDLKNITAKEFIRKVKEWANEIAITNDYKLNITENVDDSILKVDPKLFERVVQNIMVNCTHYAPKNSIISLEMNTNEDKLIITFKDQGCGFTCEELLHATECFYRGDKSRHSSTSHGLGLYIVAEIMKIHDGEIKLENNENNGASISLSINYKKY